MTILVAVETPEVEGVKVRRHVLDHEAARFIGITQRLGKRLSYWLRTTPVHQPPDQYWLEMYAHYGRGVTAMLREQRARAALTVEKGRVALTDEQFAAELEDLATETLENMSDSQFERLAAKRKSHRSRLVSVAPLIPAEVPVSMQTATEMSQPTDTNIATAPNLDNAPDEYQEYPEDYFGYRE